ncbi:FISUMP domain-containing protein [Empedobacter stercoris]|uniref:FISUMP domain-containing protein n=1 Tax=Empedobacter stercoris TaxID=1628248 RepID=UPI001CE19506|nr:FISUMP domain-containing protein [Empedobacter stercoris]
MNGVTWAISNVGYNGTFTKSPEDIGMLYQWNSIEGFEVLNLNNNDSIKDWDSIKNGKWIGSSPFISLNFWSNNVCPVGWHVPSTDEFESLISSKSTYGKLNGKSGYYFGKKGNQIFLPTTGMISSNGVYYFKDKIGAYWSSESHFQDLKDARYMIVEERGVIRLSGLRSFGHCIRCVKDKN